MTVKLLIPEDVIQVSKLAIGVYGVNGVGKTTLAATIPEDIPTVCIYAAGEPGLKRLWGKPHIWIIPIERTWEELGEAYGLISKVGTPPGLLEFLKASVERDPARRSIVERRLKDPRFREKKEPFFGAVIVDTWTRLQALAIAQATGAEPPEPGKEAEYIDKPFTGPRGSNTRLLWGNVGALVSDWQRYFVRLPMHKIFLYQEMSRKSESEVETDEKIGVALTPASAATTYEVLEVLGRIYTVLEKDPSADTSGSTKSLDAGVKEVRHLFIGQHDNYRAKGDTELLGRIIREPTWEKIAGPMLAKATQHKMNEKKGE